MCKSGQLFILFYKDLKKKKKKQLKIYGILKLWYNQTSASCLSEDVIC